MKFSWAAERKNLLSQIRRGVKFSPNVKNTKINSIIPFKKGKLLFLENKSEMLLPSVILNLGSFKVCLPEVTAGLDFYLHYDVVNQSTLI